MSWQQCPICFGSGYIGVGFPTGARCDVCDGQKIISTITGLPPSQVVIGTSIEMKFPDKYIEEKDQESE